MRRVPTRMAGEPGPTAFVFAGGGSLGAIQVGVLRELVAAGVRPDFVVGASVGALNACYFASRPDVEGVAELDAIWRSLRRSDVFPFSIASALGALSDAGSLFGSGALRRLIERHLPIRNLEDSAIPAYVVATDLSGAAVCLSRGPAVDAILASAAIPIAFPPVRIGKDDLIDGAIAGNTPLLTAAELGATRIVVLQTGYACSIDGPPKGAIARGLHAITLLIANQMQRDLQLLGDRVAVHVAPHLCPLDVSPLNFDQSGALIERAAQAARSWIAEGGLKHADASDVFEHTHAGMMQAPAAGGFDLVSYFSPAGPAFGASDFSAEHAGKLYVFASGANRAAFLEAPQRYLPAYDGLCAYAMARGQSVPGDPRVYSVIADRLFFNLNAHVRDKWEREGAVAIQRGDAHWTTIEKAEG